VAHIVLIGPIGVGKSTVAPLVASLTGRSIVSMDEVRFDYFRRAGYDDTLAATFGSSGDIAGLIAYWKPYEADAVEQLVVDESDAVLDFGAGHADYPDGPLLDRVAAALAEHFVVLLMPAKSTEESAQLLRPQLDDEHAGAVHELNRGFIASPSFRQLADTTVYVAGRTPAEIAAEVVERWRATAPRASASSRPQPS
jgi:shikimate kinase